MASLQGALHSPGHRAHCPTPCPAWTTTSDSAGHPQSAETAYSYGAPSLCWPVLEAYVAGQYLGEKLTYEKFETGFIKKGMLGERQATLIYLSIWTPRLLKYS